MATANLCYQQCLYNATVKVQQYPEANSRSLLFSCHHCAHAASSTFSFSYISVVGNDNKNYIPHHSSRAQSLEHVVLRICYICQKRMNIFDKDKAWAHIGLMANSFPNQWHFVRPNWSSTQMHAYELESEKDSSFSFRNSDKKSFRFSANRVRFAWCAICVHRNEEERRNDQRQQQQNDKETARTKIRSHQTAALKLSNEFDDARTYNNHDTNLIILHET